MKNSTTVYMHQEKKQNTRITVTTNNTKLCVCVCAQLIAYLIYSLFPYFPTSPNFIYESYSSRLI